jgi:putative phage-type endonuclease
MNELNTYLTNIIESYINSIILENNFLNQDYKYTLIPEEIYNKILENTANKFSIDVSKVKSAMNDIIKNKIMNYFEDVSKLIEKLNEREYFEQKSLKWHKVRQTMLTATDAEKIISGTKGNFFEVLKRKYDKIKSQPLSNAPPLVHGTTYEDVSVKIYESRNNVRVKEYTIMNSETHEHIGASPDGIITKVDFDDYNSYSRYGRMLEIKNPYSRRINGKIKPEYASQMQQQMFVARLPMCDFLETEIKDIRCINSSTCYDKQYEDIQEMLNDKLDTSVEGWEKKVENKNIPVENLNKFGLEKGVIVVFSKTVAFKDDSHPNNEEITETLQTVEIYPLEIPYKYEEIIKWISDKKEHYIKNGYQMEIILNWKLYKYSVITVQYNQHKYENDSVPKLNEGWKKIQEYIKNHTVDEIRNIIESNKKPSSKNNIKYNYEIDLNSVLI